MSPPRKRATKDQIAFLEAEIARLKRELRAPQPGELTLKDAAKQLEIEPSILARYLRLGVFVGTQRHGYWFVSEVEMRTIHLHLGLQPKFRTGEFEPRTRYYRGRPLAWDPEEFSETRRRIAAEQNARAA